MGVERTEAERARLLEEVVARATKAALDDYEQRLAGGIAFSFMGMKLSGRGRAVLVVVTIASILAGLLIHDMRDQESADKGRKEHVSIEDRLNEVIYVLTLSQAERERLNLSMPESLRRKQRAREQ